MDVAGLIKTMNGFTLLRCRTSWTLWTVTRKRRTLQVQRGKTRDKGGRLAQVRGTHGGRSGRESIGYPDLM